MTKWTQRLRKIFDYLFQDQINIVDKQGRLDVEHSRIDTMPVMWKKLITNTMLTIRD